MAARLLLTIFVLCPASLFAADTAWPKVTKVEAQPLAASIERLIAALDFVGAPLSMGDRESLESALKFTDGKEALAAVQKILDPHCVAAVIINPESRVSVVEGPVKKELIQQGWRTFLVKVHNEAGVTAPLKTESANLLPVYERGKGARERPMTDQTLVQPSDVPHRFLDAVVFGNQPLKPTLSGLELEYRVLQLFSRDAGKREAQLGFHVGQGTQDLGFRNTVPILFDCLPAVDVTFGVKDFDGKPTTAAFVIRDKFNRVYPNPARRLAPDFFFHDQIYRADGETVTLPPGEYTVTSIRGPEYRSQVQTIKVPEKGTTKADFKLQRWIHAAERQWFSGDHHVHAAGCAHYDSPTEGVGPEDMLRHILGEDLNIGCVLSWGPCWYTQKKYFEGKVSDLSKPNYLMRYDVEVSGFPSSHAGHLCLLRLTEDDYPGAEFLEQWPSWTQPVLEWGQKQGAVVGYSHSGWGLALPDIMPDGSRQFSKHPWGGAPAGWPGKAADKLPDYAMPPFDGIGANEYVVTAANNACDFISAVDTPAIWELNIWYHTLNVGLTSRISGETDFPCIYGDKVGLGRIYVKMPKDKPLDYDEWVLGVKDGRSYCGDGLSHIFDFAVNGLGVGEKAKNGKISQLELTQPGKVAVTFDVAALLAEEQTPQTQAIRAKRLDEKPYWHLERCRIGDTRTVPVEVIVNGQVVVKKDIIADGSTQPQKFDVAVEKSSWIAVRILPSVHTNPVFVEVAGQPVRASRRSAEWLRKAVDVCWEQKEHRIRAEEKDAARKAYDHAAAYYDAAIKASAAE
ncbi:MAG TPA: CehA/McbA family metallohydrolase [Planctomycetaceae bacterium]|nr:CehA/McbA family metallohydrolase [Planctomycetaceae bacterium]